MTVREYNNFARSGNGNARLWMLDEEGRHHFVDDDVCRSVMLMAINGCSDDEYVYAKKDANGVAFQASPNVAHSGDLYIEYSDLSDAVLSGRLYV